MKAIGYFRETSPAGGSLAEQNKAFMEFCAREGLEADGTFVDGEVSNGNGNGHGNGHGNPAGFRQLLLRLRQAGGGFVVVVPSFQALGTGIADAARRYFQIEGLGARVAPMSGKPDVTDEIVTLWNERDGPARVGDRVRAAMRRKAVKGEVLGRPPYGYKVGSRRRLELIPEEAVVVRYIFRLYLQEGLGIRLIARRLNEEGLKTRRGGNWSMVSIRDILRNRVYLGTYQRFGVRVPGSHTALVSPADFREVQDRLNARRTSYNPRVPSQFLLSGIAYCGYCGNKLIGVSRKQTWKRKSGDVASNSYRYYQCESRTNQSVCGYHTRRADRLEADVRAELARAVDHSEDDGTTDEDARALAERECERLRAQARAIDRHIERYVDNAARGRITRDKLRKLTSEAAADRLALEDAIDAAERRLSEHLDAGARRRDRLSAARALVDGWETRPMPALRPALREAVARISVTDDTVSIALRG